MKAKTFAVPISIQKLFAVFTNFLAKPFSHCINYSIKQIHIYFLLLSTSATLIKRYHRGNKKHTKNVLRFSSYIHIDKCLDLINLYK